MTKSRGIRIRAEQRFALIGGEPQACWPWTGHVDHQGYGVFKANKHHVPAHRRAYERANGPIPEGFVIDHTCHSRDLSCPGGATCPHRRCVNPAHLEPVTSGENTLRGRNRAAVNARKTHCQNGHPLTGENVEIRNGMRRCRSCPRARRSRAA